MKTPSGTKSSTEKMSLMEKLLKNSPTKYTSILSESEFFNDKDVIPTDIPIINIAFSGSLDGGLASGLTLFAGPSKTFKSNVSLVCVRAYLNKYKDAVCIFYDSEGGITPQYIKSQGIDISRVIHVPIEHLEMLKFDLVKRLDTIDRGEKVIIVIDSIGNTASLKELEDALDGKSKAEMQRAKTIKGLFRMVTPSLVSKDIPCIAICHTYEEIGSNYPRQIISGGLGLVYSANQAFIIGKSQEKEGKDLVGFNFTLNVEKSRFVREKSKLEFTVLYESGIQKYSGLLDLAIEGNFIDNSSQGWYSKIDKDGKPEAKKYRFKETNTNDFWKDLLKNKEFNNYIKFQFQLNSENYSNDSKFSDLENEEI